MPPKKRKSTGTPATDSVSKPPAKRARKPESAAAEQTDKNKGPATPDEKGGRGRPRKHTVDATPKPTTPRPKRGKDRPPKDTAKKDTPKQHEPSRPKKNSTQNEADVNSAPPKYMADENGRRYWLMKAEPESRLERGVDVKFSIDDLRACTQPEPWDGIRNFVARNHMREMKKGDYAFFYHSNCKVPGIAGYMEIVREHSTDESAFDPAHPYYDEKSKRDNPKWSVVHVEFRHKFDHLITLNDLKSHAADGPLKDLQTLKQSRLSVSPVTPQQWEYIMKLAEKKE